MDFHPNDARRGYSIGRHRGREFTYITFEKPTAAKRSKELADRFGGTPSKGRGFGTPSFDKNEEEWEVFYDAMTGDVVGFAKVPRTKKFDFSKPISIYDTDFNLIAEDAVHHGRDLDWNDPNKKPEGALNACLVAAVGQELFARIEFEPQETELQSISAVLLFGGTSIKYCHGPNNLVLLCLDEDGDDRKVTVLHNAHTGEAVGYQDLTDDSSDESMIYDREGNELFMAAQEPAVFPTWVWAQNSEEL